MYIAECASLCVYTLNRVLTYYNIINIICNVAKEFQLGRSENIASRLRDGAAATRSGMRGARAGGTAKRERRETTGNAEVVGGRCVGIG
jgi:hypothetical protein